MIHINDLTILQQLFFDKSLNAIVFDPQDRLMLNAKAPFIWLEELETLKEVVEKNPQQKLLIFNLSLSEIDFDFSQTNISGVIHFNEIQNRTTATKFYYINNPDKSMRWVFPKSNSNPVFLTLYNNAGWKATAYRAAMKVAYRSKTESLLTSGCFMLENRSTNIERFFNQNEVDEYAIFTGTAGANRKAIITLFQDNRCSNFVKIPLTPKANDLIRNEQQQLEWLNSIGLDKMEIPKGHGERGYLSLTNVQPRQIVNSETIGEKHLMALAECYEKTCTKSMPSQISSWSQTKKGLDFLKGDFQIQNTISKDETNVMIQHLIKLEERFQTFEKLPVALAHGDFTPWNMYETTDKIHVYDWEMSCTDLPLLFDVFHYVFQSNILIKQANYKEIKTELEQIKKHPIVQQLLIKYDFDWSDHYEFYLLNMVTYYLPLYTQQKDLHLQAHWLIDVWADALSDLSEELVEPVL